MSHYGGRQPSDLVGKQFGQLTVLEFLGTRNHHGIWRCVCVCGAVVERATDSLRSAHEHSCGCLPSSFKQHHTRQGPYKPRQKRMHLHLPKDEPGLTSLIASYKARALLRNIIFDLTRADFKGLISQACFYCGLPPCQVRRTDKQQLAYSGVDRIDNKLGYVIGNVRPCCKQCNVAKNAYTEVEFLTWVKRIHAHLFTQG